MSTTPPIPNQIHLLKTRRFAPFFWVQFLGALNDNLIKTVMVMLIAYGLWDNKGWDTGVLVALASGLFILPFILVTPLAGNLSDKYDKARIIRRVKLAEIFIILTAIAVLYSSNIYLGLLILLLLGLQSAFFSPAKFSILPQHLHADELIAGNAFVSSGTYIAILLGTIMGALIATTSWGFAFTAIFSLSIALAGYIAARHIPEAPPPEPELKISYNIFGRILGVTRNALGQEPAVRLSIMAVSFFYLMAATFHSQFANFTKETLGADHIVLTAFMITFSLGIAIGGFLNHKLLSARTDGRWTPLACLCMGVFGIDLYFTALSYPKSAEGLHDILTFIQQPQGLRLLADTFLQSLACGFYVVPLRAIVQARTEKKIRARVISGSNMLDALFILASSVLSTTLLSQGYTIPELYLSVSLLTVIMALTLMKARSLRKGV